MIEIKRKSLCDGCYACASACPQQCIQMTPDHEGFLYPNVIKENCLNCGKCETVCPILNGKTENKNIIELSYAAYSKDDTLRKESSSGGIFSLIAEQILAEGGVVVGAAMTQDYKGVEHIAIDSIAALYKLRGSKYIQSTIGDAYIKTKRILETGRPVLFTGTPCQIGGLFNFLGKDYPNLYTQDLICHGVPSPEVWKKYIELRERQFDSTVVESGFRNKERGWKKFSLVLKFSNGTKYSNTLDDDAYLQAFLNNMDLRPSCHDCKFKTIYRQSDITLADFWHIDEFFPEIDDDRGLSFVWIHSSKGRKIFDRIKDFIEYKEVETGAVIKTSPPSTNSVIPHRKRTSFLKNFKNADFELLVKKYKKDSYIRKVRTFLGRIKRKIVLYNEQL